MNRETAWRELYSRSRSDIEVDFSHLRDTNNSSIGNALLIGGQIEEISEPARLRGQQMAPASPDESGHDAGPVSASERVAQEIERLQRSSMSPDQAQPSMLGTASSGAPSPISETRKAVEMLSTQVETLREAAKDRKSRAQIQDHIGSLISQLSNLRERHVSQVVASQHPEPHPLETHSPSQQGTSSESAGPRQHQLLPNHGIPNGNCSPMSRSTPQQQPLPLQHSLQPDVSPGFAFRKPPAQQHPQSPGDTLSPRPYIPLYETDRIGETNAPNPQGYALPPHHTNVGPRENGGGGVSLSLVSRMTEMQQKIEALMRENNELRKSNVHKSPAGTLGVEAPHTEKKSEGDVVHKGEPHAGQQADNAEPVHDSMSSRSINFSARADREGVKEEDCALIQMRAPSFSDRTEPSKRKSGVLTSHSTTRAEGTADATALISAAPTSVAVEAAPMSADQEESSSRFSFGQLSLKEHAGLKANVSQTTTTAATVVTQVEITQTTATAATAVTQVDVPPTTTTEAPAVTQVDEEYEGTAAEHKAAAFIQSRFRGFVAEKQSKCQLQVSAVDAFIRSPRSSTRSSPQGTAKISGWGSVAEKFRGRASPKDAPKSKWTKAKEQIEEIKKVQAAEGLNDLLSSQPSFNEEGTPVSAFDGLRKRAATRRSSDGHARENEDDDRKKTESQEQLLRANEIEGGQFISKKKRVRQSTWGHMWIFIVWIYSRCPGSGRFTARVLHPLELWVSQMVQKLTNSADVPPNDATFIFLSRAAILVAVSVANVCVGATIYKVVTGAPWTKSLFKVYSILFNAPGTDVTAEPTPVGSFVANIIFITGILVFAVLLGMIGEEVGNQIMALRSGTGRLRLDGHILILNWNRDLVPVLRQLIAAARSRSHVYHGRTIVILGDKEKIFLDSDVSEALRAAGGETSGLEIHTSYVIMLYPESSIHQIQAHTNAEHGKAEAMKAATVAAMSTLGKFNNRNLIVQVPIEIPPEHQQLEAVQVLLAQEGLAVQVVRISEAKLVDRLVAQTSLQPGVLTVLKRTMRQGVDYAYIWIDVTEAHGGGTYAQMRRMYVDVIVLGYLSSAGVGTEEIPTSPLHLNPDEGDIVVPGDKLVALARASKRAIHRVSRMRTDEVPGKKVLVIGWPASSIHELVEGINAFAAPGTEVGCA
eukprot:gene17041-23333_t